MALPVANVYLIGTLILNLCPHEVTPYIFNVALCVMWTVDIFASNIETMNEFPYVETLYKASTIFV